MFVVPHQMSHSVLPGGSFCCYVAGRPSTLPRRASSVLDARNAIRCRTKEIALGTVGQELFSASRGDFVVVCWSSAGQGSAEVPESWSLSRLDLLPQGDLARQGRSWFGFYRALQPDLNFPNYPAVSRVAIDDMVVRPHSVCK